MNVVRRLGSTFVAFLSGAVLATGLSILTALLLDSQRPPRYGLVLAGGMCLVVGSVFMGWLAVVAGDLEALERNERSEEGRAAVWQCEARRVRALAGVGLTLALAGVLALPARLVWTGWGTGDPSCHARRTARQLSAVSSEPISECDRVRR
jgi:hypothetical protein